MNKDLSSEIKSKVQRAIIESVKSDFSESKKNQKINESFIGTTRGVGAGIGAAIIQMAGGALTFMSGAPVTGSIIFASSFLTGYAVGNLVKNNYEISELRKFDTDLTGNIIKRDELFKAYTTAASMGLVDPKQYQAKVSQLTKEQQKIGSRMLKHLMTSQQTLSKAIPQETIDKLYTLADLAKKGSLTNVEEVAKYKVQI